jgi:hypothetical protein
VRAFAAYALLPLSISAEIHIARRFSLGFAVEVQAGQYLGCVTQDAAQVSRSRLLIPVNYGKRIG